MSANLSGAAQQLFDSEVKHVFQSAGGLKDTVTNRNDVIGDIYKFRAMGKGVANQKNTSADVTAILYQTGTLQSTLTSLTLKKLILTKRRSYRLQLLVLLAVVVISLF